MRHIAIFRQLAMLFAVMLLLLACSTSRNAVSGEVAYEHKQYARAIDLLLEEYEDSNKAQTAAHKAYLLGSSYEVLNDVVAAKKWYDKAVKADYGENADRGYARVLKKSGDYAAAMNIWTELRRRHPQDANIQREIQVLKLVSEWASQAQQSVKVYEIPGNTEYNDYGPQIYEGNYLVFTSDREDATGDTDYPWTGRSYADIYLANKEGNGAKRFDAEINSNANEGTACFSQDYQTIYFTRCASDLEEKDAYCAIMYSVKEDGLWTTPEKVNFVVDNINYGQPVLIEQDSVMIFCSQGGDGPGGYDLYYSQLIEGQTWSQPYPMPNSINSAGDEYFPTVWNDTLYFSSNYLPGLGGLDIFKTYLKDGKWMAPENLKPPFNSSYDDFGLVVDDYARLRGTELQKGFFTSARGATGDDDIYAYVKYKPTEKEVVDTPKDATQQLEIYLAGRVYTDILADPEDPNSDVVGEQVLANAYVKITAQEQVEMSTDEQGTFIESLQEDRQYTITISRPGYFNVVDQISTSDIITDKEIYTINKSYKLEKIFYGKEILLSDIYYEFDKWNILDSAKPTLDRLANIMQDNPQIKIQLSSHTDCQGEDDYNAILSQKRAQSAVRYLVDKGIPFSRLQAQGYGESRLAVDCICEQCTEEEHQQNRRTTFTVLR